MNDRDVELKAMLIVRARSLINDNQIREFVFKALDQAPDYVWTMSASTSAKHHVGETQTEHVLKALRVAEKLMIILEQPATQKHLGKQNLDVFYAAVILHDLYKCGLSGQENRDETGNICTDPMHPLYPPVALKLIKVKENLPAGWAKTVKMLEPMEVTVDQCSWWEDFSLCVTAHMGPWSPLSDHADNACCTFGNFAMLTFLADYLSCQKGIDIDIN